MKRACTRTIFDSPLRRNNFTTFLTYTIAVFSLQAQELLLVEKLKWDLLAVTGFDFIDHILQRIKWSRHDQMIRRHSLVLLHLCYTGKKGPYSIFV